MIGRSGACEHSKSRVLPLERHMARERDNSLKSETWALARGRGKEIGGGVKKQQVLCGPGLLCEARNLGM